MTGREKMETALTGNGAPEIPVVICYEGIYVRDHWGELTDRPWWALFSPDLDEQVAWQRDVIERTGQDWFVLSPCASRDERAAQRLEPRGDELQLTDQRSGETRTIPRPRVAGWSPTGHVASIHPDRVIEDIDEIDRRIPLPEPFDAARFRAEGRGDLADRMLDPAGPGAGLFPITHVSSPLWNCYMIWGFEGMMTMVLDRPDLIEHVCRRRLEHVRVAIQAAAALGVRGVWLEECITDIISPEAFAKLNVPYLKQIVQAIRDAGMKSVYYYCGDPTGKWDLLLEVGADALSLEESKKGFDIDIDDVVDRAGARCAVLGNLDAMDLLERGDEEALRTEIARQLAAGRSNGNRFIMSIGSPVTPDTSVERVRRYCDITRELQR